MTRKGIVNLKLTLRETRMTNLDVHEDALELSDEELTEIEQGKNEKKFTQEEMDRAIKNRVAREKSVTAKLREEFESYKASTDEAIEKYEESVKSQVETLSEDIPEAMKILLGKLPYAEQLAWLTDPENKLDTKKTSPITPVPIHEEKLVKHEKVGRLF